MNTHDKTLESEQSLQDAFQVFLAKKRAERIKMVARSKPIQRTKEEKDRLRKLFVERAMSYCGVPYSRKEHPAESELARYPIQLDCCGLIRQTLMDLKEEFGFEPLPYNQAYQFDTLPMRYDTISDSIREGDLIFYEGVYFDNKKRPQKHNMVHVEIYLGGEGTPERCLGSRFRKQVVSVFDSYKFTSTVWELKRLYFCSIDTWLDGICKSVCPLHQWERVSTVGCTKGSIFEPLSEEDLVADPDDI